MNLKFIANFLNNNFYSFDYNILKFWHSFAELTNNKLTNIFKFITFITEKGLIFVLIAVIFMMFKKTRKIGVCMFGAVGLGAILSTFTLKDFVARTRPFMLNDEFKLWWEFVKKPIEEGFSFPSGHTTGASAAMMALFLSSKNKKKSVLGFVVVLLVGISRNYLIAHYPTDVIAGVIIGLISAIVSYYITKLIYYILNKYDNKLFRFIKEFNIVKG